MSTLRFATPADIPYLVNSRIEMFRDMEAEKGWSLAPDKVDEIERVFTSMLLQGLNSVHFAWIVEVSGAPVSCGIVTLQAWLPVPSIKDSTRAYFHTVYTLPVHRGKGYARLITEEAIRWVQERGFPFLMLHASRKGRPVYEKMGFQTGSEMVLDLRTPAVSHAEAAGSPSLPSR